MKMRIIIAIAIVLVGIATYVFGKDRWEWTDKEALSIAGMVVSYLTVWWSIYTWDWIKENSHAFWFWYSFSNKEPSDTPWVLMGVVAFVVYVVLFFVCLFTFLSQEKTGSALIVFFGGGSALWLPIFYVITKQEAEEREHNRLRYIHIDVD